MEPKTIDLRQPFSPFPSGPRGEHPDGDSHPYHEQMRQLKNMTAESVHEEFRGQVICEVTCERHNFLLVKRVENDAPVDMDVMIVAVPKNKKVLCPLDYETLTHFSELDAMAMIDIMYTIQNHFRDRGATDTMAVLNSSMYDMGATKIGGKILTFKTPQSAGWPHIKIFGYRLTDLQAIERKLTRVEEEQAFRPLNVEFSGIVIAVAKGLVEPNQIVDNQDPRLPPFIYINDNRVAIEIYHQVYHLLNEINHMLNGPASIVLSVGHGRGGITAFEAQAAAGIIPEELRVSNNGIIRYAEMAIPRVTGESENIWPNELVRQNAPAVAGYLRGVVDYVTKEMAEGRDVFLPWGGSFSVLFSQLENRRVMQVVDATFVRKGANPVSGILAMDEHRPLSADEKGWLSQSVVGLRNELTRRYGGRVKPGDFDIDKYSQRFVH